MSKPDRPSAEVDELASCPGHSLATAAGPATVITHVPLDIDPSGVYQPVCSRGQIRDLQTILAAHEWIGNG